VGVQIDSNGTSFTQAPSNYYSRLLPSIQLSHSSRQMDNSTQTLELIDRSNSPRRPIFNLSLQHMDNSPRGISEADEIVHKKRISLRENSILTVIEKQTAAIEKLTERIEKETKKEQRSFEGSLSQQALKLRQSILLGKDFLSQKKIQDEPSPKYSKENFKRKSILKKITNEAALQSLIKLQIENKFKNENNKLNRVTFAEETSVSKAEIFSDSSDGNDEKTKESLSKSRSEPLIHFKIPSQEKSEKELSDSREIRFLNARRPQFNLSSSEDSSQKNSENETEQESLSNIEIFIWWIFYLGPKRKKRGTRRVITPGKSKLGIKTIDQGEKAEKIIK